MFVAAGEARLGSAFFRGNVAIDRHVLIHTVEHQGTVLDTRFIPPMARALDATILYVVLSGRIEWHAPWNESFDAPCAFIMGWEDYDGQGGVRRQSFRASGASFLAVEVRTMEPFRRNRPTVAVCSDRLLANVRSYAQAAHDGPDHAVERAVTLLGLLEEDKLIPPGTTAGVRRVEDERLTRLWSAIANTMLALSGH